jgi:hypothetical protein
MTRAAAALSVLVWLACGRHRSGGAITLSLRAGSGPSDFGSSVIAWTPPSSTSRAAKASTRQPFSPILVYRLDARASGSAAIAVANLARSTSTTSSAKILGEAGVPPTRVGRIMPSNPRRGPRSPVTSASSAWPNVVADHVPRGRGPTAGCGRSVGGRIAVLQFRLGSANLSGRFRIPCAWLDGVHRSRDALRGFRSDGGPRSSTERH